MADEKLSELSAISLPVQSTDVIYIIRPNGGGFDSFQVAISNLPGGTPADGSVTLAKLANLAHGKFIARSTAGTGVPEAVDITTAGFSMVAAADAAAQRTLLSLGSAALQASSAFDAAGAAAAAQAASQPVATNLTNFSQADVTVASATTTNIGAAASDNVIISGTTTITGLGTVAAGTRRHCRFSGVLTLTHNATSLILPNGGANIATGAGDRMIAESLGSGNWVVTAYQRASGTALAGSGGTGGSAQVVYTSATCTSDADLALGSSTFGTDNTTALQALLDLAATAPVHIIVDGQYSVTGLQIRSNTQVTGLPGCGLILRSSAARPIFRNYNRENTDTAVYDSNITIEHLIINGNQANNPTEETGFTYHFLDGLDFSGVINLRVTDIELRDVKKFGILIGDYKNAYVSGIRGVHSSDYINTDLVHIWGPGVGQLVIRDCESDGLDDVIAISGDEMAAGTPDPQPFETFGDLDNVLVENIRLNGANQGVRFFNINYRVNSLTVRNITGTCGSYAFTSYPFQAGPGNVGQLLIDGIDVKLRSLGNGQSSVNDETVGFLWNVISLDSFAESTVIKNISVGEFGDDRPLIYIGPNATGPITIDGFTILDTSTTYQTNTHGRITVGGATLKQLTVSNVKWQKPSTSPIGVLILNDGGSITDLDVTAALVTDTDAIVKNINGGTIDTLLLESVRMKGGGTAAVQADGTNLVAAGYVGPDITNGTWTNTDTAAAIIEAGVTIPTATAKYDFEDTSDSAGSFTLTNVGGTTFTSGLVSNAATFNGSTQYLHSLAGALAGTFAIAFWMKTSTTQIAELVCQRSTTGSDGDRWVSILDTDHKVKFAVFQTGLAADVIASTVDCDDGTWHFIVFSYDAATKIQSLIVDNGTPVTNTNLLPAYNVNPEPPLTFGVDRNSGTLQLFYTGQLDACRFWAGTIPSSAALTALYNAGAGLQ